MAKHPEYEIDQKFQGKKKYYLFDNYNGELREAKKPIQDNSSHWISIGEWQNHIGDGYRDNPIKIIAFDNKVVLNSTIILNLAKEIKKFRKTRGIRI